MDAKNPPLLVATFDGKRGEAVEPLVDHGVREAGASRVEA